MIDLGTYQQAVETVAWRAVLEPSDRRLLAVLLLGVPAWQGVVRGARALDHFVAPAHRRQPVRTPVFVVGHPRSGTTFLHRLLALDPRFSTPRAWQVALPAVSLYRLVRTGGRLGLGRSLPARLERRLFDGLGVQHEVAWDAPEEDDWLLVQAGASPTVGSFVGKPDLGARYWLGDDLPPEVRDRVVHWYRRSVQRHLFATDPGATLLSKNPHFTGWMRTLHHAFPGARFVMLVRDPTDAIASRFRLISPGWRTRGRRPPEARVRVAFEASCAVYRHAEAAWPELPDPDRLRVRYDRLVADPEATVAGVYAHFGWTMDPEVRARIAEAAAQARRRVPPPPAKLRHYGIRPGEVADALGDLDTLWESLGRRPAGGHR